MNHEHTNDTRWCYFHPKELVVGVCALCLNERLLVLASKQSHLHQTYNFTPKIKVLPKVFALTSFLNRLDIKKQKSEVYYDSSSSQEDSFISIKFEDNGVASWDKGKISKMSSNKPLNESWDKEKKIKSVIEHAKPRGTLRWRKRIGHLFQVIRWRRSTKANMCHVGTKLEGAKVKYGWIRTLTKRRTKE
ncbi:hypothetical protein CDL12_11182 [Handroanthus impetiginosus]|uniref:Uncharacterized protein n=1 Tax=Handroanthus impetiginosus TaxID=429701 RepID=A0A2G9HFV4_9LAMI|nr:hypothetical protein CDL12_11182 [Handroanthus impetiginosus]